MREARRQPVEVSSRFRDQEELSVPGHKIAVLFNLKWKVSPLYQEGEIDRVGACERNRRAGIRHRI